MASADNDDNSNNNRMNPDHINFDYNGIYNGHKDGREKGHNNGTDSRLRSQNTAFLEHSDGIDCK